MPLRRVLLEYKKGKHFAQESPFISDRRHLTIAPDDLREVEVRTFVGWYAQALSGSYSLTFIGINPSSGYFSCHLTLPQQNNIND